MVAPALVGLRRSSHNMAPTQTLVRPDHTLDIGGSISPSGTLDSQDTGGDMPTHIPRDPYCPAPSLWEHSWTLAEARVNWWVAGL
jgi:hypothetical protein